MKYYFLLWILLCVSCDLRDDDNSEITTNNILTFSLEATKEAIILSGDTTAYDELSIAYLDENIPEEILFYSLIMSNEFGYTQAHFDVFINIIKLYKKKPEKINAGFSKIAIEHLLIAHANGHNQAIEYVKDYNIVESSNYDQIMKQIISN